MCRIEGMNAISRAIESIGSASKLADVLGVTPQAVCFWRDGLRKFPAELCPRVERATSRAITCEDLRPDVDWSYLRGTTPSPTNPAAQEIANEH